MARGKCLSEDMRNAIIKEYKKNISAYDIAKILEISRSSVRNIINLFKKTGNVNPLTKTGRPPIATDRDRRSLRKILKNDRHATLPLYNITLEWKNAIKKQVSRDTCIREMKKMGYKFYKVILIIFPLYFIILEN